mmetsp:Transcript_34406/g.102814  ORF Transcript_34406/g.102814 Transcript_34406/m.102814 type:complete len:221 (+) Transcript_34406:791-1453(+)
MVWQALTAPSMALVHFRSTARALPSIFASSFLASNIGPLAVLLILANCSLTQARDAAIPSVVCVWSFSASSKTDTGVANASNSAPLREVSGCNASSRDFKLTSIASTFTAASAKIASAAFLSRASMCAFFSAASLLANSNLAATTFFLKASKPVCVAVTLGRAFASSVLASDSGPLFPALVSSAVLILRKFDADVMLFEDSPSALSIVAAKVLNGVMASK